MEQDFNIEHWQDKKCPSINCRKKTCICGLEKVFLPAVLGDDSKDSPIAPKNGEYCNAIVVYEANGHMYIYSKEGIPTLITSGGGGDYDEIIKEIQEDLAKTEGDLAKEVLDRAAGDKTLQDEIDEIKNSPDVVDIVATYAALQSYDTSKLGDNDIVRVLQDEMHDGQSTYYRWNKQSSTWTYIGSVGDYYTKGQVDTLLADKQNELTAGSNIAITQSGDDLVISATDTTYSNFVGTDGVTAGSAGLVPAPATTDAGKFLKADGTWDAAGGGSNIVRALTTDDYNYPTNNPNSVNPGMLVPGMYFVNDSSLNVYNGVNRNTNRNNIVFIVSGTAGDPTNMHEMAVIDGTNAAATDSYKISFYYVDLATGSTVTRGDLLDKSYIVNNLTTNNSNRILSAAQGKVLKDALDGRIKTNAGAPTTTTAGTVGQLIEDTTNGKLYICTDATNPYVWEEIGAGGSGSGVAKELTSGDYDYPSGSADGVALWTLDEGLYHSAATVKVYWTSSYGLQNQDALWLVTKVADGYSYVYRLDSTNNQMVYRKVQTSTGIQSGTESRIAKLDDIYADPDVGHQIRIGSTGNISNYAVRIGYGGQASNTSAVSIGQSAQATGLNSTALGMDTLVTHRGSVALGSAAQTTVKGQIMVGTTNTYDGYNSTNYRIISGVHDAQSTNDAVNLGQLNSRVIGSLTAAPTTSTAGSVGSLLATVESGTGHLYICTDDTGGSYTWSQLV